MGSQIEPDKWEQTVIERPAPYWNTTEICKGPLPELKGQFLTRLFTRTTLLLKRKNVLGIEGIEHVSGQKDPFIVVANHSQRSEALLLPAILFFLRKGRRIHFMADWNFCLFPPIGLLYWCGEVILLTRKPAKPMFLNIFRPLFTSRLTGFAKAHSLIKEGKSIGIFPEGTTNRHPKRLLKGYSGAARLALETGIPVVPTGLYFPGFTGVQPIQESSPVQIRFAPPILPVARVENPTLQQIKSLHEEIMTEISRLCGKSWQRRSQRK